MDANQIEIVPVSGKAGRAAFVDLGRQFAAKVPHAVPQLRSELLELLDPARNPFFDHARVQLFIAWRNGTPVGRISAHIDELALTVPEQQGLGPGTGMFGLFDAADEAVAHALLARAQDWLRSEGMTRVLGPVSLSVWEEIGLLVHGHDHAPMLMMGHHPAQYQSWIENAGYTRNKTLLTYELAIDGDFPPLVQRIIRSGQRNDRIVTRPISLDRFEEDVRIVLTILNDAWSRNWGFVPFTDREIAYVGKKMRPLIKPELNRIAEVDGEPVAFMMTLPDLNDVLGRVNGTLWPLGWFHLLRWLRKPRGSGMRVPLMGVSSHLQNSRMASQLAFMLIGEIRTNAHEIFASKRAEIGWILDDNQGMIAIADAIGSTINREYAVYARDIAN